MLVANGVNDPKEFHDRSQYLYAAVDGNVFVPIPTPCLSQQMDPEG
jgi:hypothetical protein